MTPLEKALDFSADEISGDEIAETAERDLVGDFVEEEAGVGPIGEKAMGVFPAAERAANLDVSKLATRNIVAMLGDPEKAKRTDAKRHASAVFDATGAGNNAQALTRRSEVFKSAGLGMPAVERGGGSANASAFGELTGRHVENATTGIGI